jgi:hypothetical protein
MATTTKSVSTRKNKYDHVGTVFPRPIASITDQGGESPPLRLIARLQLIFKDHKFVGHFLAAFLPTFRFDRMISGPYTNGTQLTSCHLRRRHRLVQSNYASRQSPGSGLANYPPRRSYYQPAPLGRIVGFSMPIARGGACASKR